MLFAALTSGAIRRALNSLPASLHHRRLQVRFSSKTILLIKGTRCSSHFPWVVGFSSLSGQEKSEVMPDSLQPHGLQPPRLLRPWDFPGKNTGVGCRFLLQGIFPTQGSNPGCALQAMLYPLSHQGSSNKPITSSHRNQG